MTYLFYPGYVREHHIETTEKIIVFLNSVEFPMHANLAVLFLYAIKFIA